MFKMCNVCSLDKHISEFSKDSSRITGDSYRCKTCQKLYSKKHHENNLTAYANSRRKYKKKIKDWYRAYKETLKCSFCGENKYDLLDFHHIEEKYKGVARLVADNESIDKIKLEMSKCIVLCKNCHIKEHYPSKK